MIVVIGAGLAGLAAASVLKRSGQEVKVLEATDKVGGRVQSEVYKGFTIDRGFQVLFTAYPAVRRNFDLDDLDCVALEPGLVLQGPLGRSVVARPGRHLGDLWSTLRSPYLLWKDRLKLLQWIAYIRRGEPQAFLKGEDRSTLEELRAWGFSEYTIDHLFRPFWGGVFLDTSLRTSAKLFRYYARMLMEGSVAIPRRGMGELPRQLARRLDIVYGVRVEDIQVHSDNIELKTHRGSWHAKSVVVATDPPEIRRLTQITHPFESVVSTYLYYASSKVLDRSKKLILNTEASLVHSAFWNSNLIPECAPEGKHLLTVVVLEMGDSDKTLDEQVRADLARWYGQDVSGLELLAIHAFPHAQFLQLPNYDKVLTPQLSPLPGVYIASELNSMSSIQGALESGERAAAMILQDLQGMSRPRGA